MSRDRTEYTRKYWTEHREKRLAQCAAYRASHREEIRLKQATRRAIFGIIKYGNNNKKDACELCLFKAIDSCQLDVHHMDGNHDNNEPPNLQTLCANCHRLITKRDGHNKPKTPRTITLQRNIVKAVIDKRRKKKDESIPDGIQIILTETDTCNTTNRPIQKRAQGEDTKKKKSKKISKQVLDSLLAPPTD